MTGQVGLISVDALSDVAVAAATTADFEDFYREKASAIHRGLAIALGNEALGQEATDEAFARAFQHWRKIHGYDNPAGWVYRVGLNWGRSRLRKTKREVMSNDVIPSGVVAPIEPGLDDAIAALPIKLRSVVVLRYLLDWSVEETADALRIPAGTVKSRLSRALGQLAEALEGAR